MKVCIDEGYLKVAGENKNSKKQTEVSVDNLKRLKKGQVVN